MFSQLERERKKFAHMTRRSGVLNAIGKSSAHIQIFSFSGKREGESGEKFIFWTTARNSFFSLYISNFFLSAICQRLLKASSSRKLFLFHAGFSILYFLLSKLRITSCLRLVKCTNVSSSISSSSKHEWMTTETWDWLMRVSRIKIHRERKSFFRHAALNFLSQNNWLLSFSSALH